MAINVSNCPSCDGVGEILLLGSLGCLWSKCVTCVGVGKLTIKDPVRKLPPIQFSGNSPFPLAKD